MVKINRLVAASIQIDKLDEIVNVLVHEDVLSQHTIQQLSHVVRPYTTWPWALQPLCFEWTTYDNIHAWSHQGHLCCQTCHNWFGHTTLYMDHISSYTDQFPDVCTPGILKDEAKAYTPAQSCPQQIINIIL